MDLIFTSTISVKTVLGPYDACCHAVDIVNYDWSFNPATNGNKALNNIPSGVKQPYYLEGLTQITAQEGIPYSFYGSRGIDIEYKTNNNLNFPQGVSAEKYTGNAGDDVVTEDTYGLDCSGFVDVVFKIGEKHSTLSLVGSGNPFYYVSQGMGPMHMDIFNSLGDHVFIYHSEEGYSGDIWYTIFESTTTYRYRGGGTAHADKTVCASFDVDSANLTNYSIARLNGW